VERGVEVYERLKSRPGIAAWNPLSVGIAYAAAVAAVDEVQVVDEPAEEARSPGGVGPDAVALEYEVERGVEVYERLKSRPGIAAWNPLSVGIAYAMIESRPPSRPARYSTMPEVSL
jgi:aryl carrier-like protein